MDNLISKELRNKINEKIDLNKYIKKKLFLKQEFVGLDKNNMKIIEEVISIYENNDMEITYNIRICIFKHNGCTSYSYEFLLKIKLLNTEMKLTEDDLDFLLSLNIPLFKSYQCKYIVNWNNNYGKFMDEKFVEINDNGEYVVPFVSKFYEPERREEFDKNYNDIKPKFIKKIRKILGNKYNEKKVILRSFSAGSFLSLGINNITLTEYLFNPLYTKQTTFMNIVNDNVATNVDHDIVVSNNQYSIYDDNLNLVTGKLKQEQFSNKFNKKIFLHSLNNGTDKDMIKTIYVGYTDLIPSYSIIKYHTDSYKSSRFNSLIKVEKELINL